MKLSKRSDIESFRVLDTLRTVNQLTARGEDIIRLEVGQPCFGPPKGALEALHGRMQKDNIMGYTQEMGLRPLRDRIVQHYDETYGYTLDVARLAVTVGSSAGLVMTFIAAFDAGDKVGLITPTYPAYRNTLRALDLDPIEIQATSETNFQPTAELLENCPTKLDGLIINSPSNPTGNMIDEAELKKICEWCDQNGVRLISDEAYHGITYEESAQTAAKYSETAIITNTFSKYFAMTGWRLGWLILPLDLADRVQKLAQNMFICPPAVSQFLALETFKHMDVLDANVAKYKENRDILRELLPDAGITDISVAHGAFYIYAKIGDLTNDSEDFCSRMLHEAKVSAISGVDCDPQRGHQTMRISYAGTCDDMREACRRIKAWLPTY